MEHVATVTAFATALEVWCSCGEQISEMEGDASPPEVPLAQLNKDLADHVRTKTQGE